jgi:hypothetical protein
VKISVDDRAQGLLDRFSEEAAVQDPCIRLSVQDAYRRSAQKVFVRDLKERSLFKVSRNALRHQVSAQDLLHRGLLARSVYKISARALLARSPQSVSWQDL